VVANKSVLICLSLPNEVILSFNFLYSDASLTYGAVYNNNVDLKDDYINYLSFAITGGANLVDIFSNTSNLLQEVVNMNNRFNDKIQTSLNSVNTIYNTLYILLRSISIYNLSILRREIPPLPTDPLANPFS
jgi:hypothetical protein